MYLLVVESPNKVAKLSKILGHGWKIVSTKGHIEDLPAGCLGGLKIIREDGQIVEIPRTVNKRVNFAIDVKNGFRPFYTLISGREAVVAEISEASKSADRAFIATDPDREGEAIAYSVSKVLGGRIPVHRVKFYSITKPEVIRAVQSPTKIDMKLVEAAHARRVLDRLIGFFISPLADAAVNKSGSEYRYTVGRVQSPALALVSEALKKRISHEPKTKYRVRIDYDFYGSVGAAGSSLFYVSALGGGTYARRDDAYSAASAAKNLIHTVKGLKTLRHNVRPPLPLKTSTMQARAFSEKGMPIAVSSRTAQSIFQRGLITYPRTDSERLSDEGVALANEMIMRLYGEKYVGSPGVAGALGRFQGAHEAIRLSGPKPARLWNEEEKKLYSLIDKYFVASRMTDAQVDETTLVVTSAIDEFVSRFRTVHNDGFTRHTGGAKKLLGNYSAPPPALQGVKPGRRISRVHVSVVEEQDPPPRVLDEASLILACEKEGIGRPSTYSDIIRKLKERAYIDDLDPYEMNYELLGNTVIDPCEDLETNYLEATQRGDKVLGYLLEEHPWVVDKGFTRDVEGMLDQVARGELGYSDVVGVVWQKLTETVPDVASYNEEINSGMRMMP